ncbi:endophilin-A2-like isoform X2 [Cyprinodon tularosa]|uniref:endophilin-A2 isoform X2 n=1 Tax=Cyprinodon variegatus TaxID=28743 RepID=UPI000742ACCB|nr:PREDICTED: endophilin-A2 isoform X2 [Cyprinodon variegatus]XP_038126576.1 endophilin-A2-like isoform X2 [Cyprinodon tularosa]
MSVAGLRKQFFKASQLMSEKVGGAEGTKLDEDFKELERKADVTSKAVMDVITKTTEYLQPNPASRAKLTMMNTVSKIRGQGQSSPGYPQSEALLGEAMNKYGRDIGEDNSFGGALVDVGDAMKRLAEVKDSLDIDVKHNFIDPMLAVADKDIKDIQHHLKKMEGRRLDYDYKKKRQGKIPDEDIRVALEKFHESRDLAESSMHSLLETDVEQVSQLAAFVDSLLQYHRQATEILEEVTGRLRERVNEAESRPKREFKPKPRQSFDYGDQENSNGAHASFSPPAYTSAQAHYPPAPVQRPSIRNKPREPCCKALYDFVPENEGELGFEEGDIITLVRQIDENWFEGRLRGESGFFPNNYVEVIVPLQH